jgi:hypothetical protein
LAVYSVLPPFLVFPDSDGTPLENGQIFIGQPGYEARTTPKASFFDTAQTIPTGTATGSAISTMGGFPARNGSPAMFYVDGDFSISVLDRNGVLLYSALNTTLAINLGAVDTGPILAPDGNIVAVGLGFINEANTGWIRSSAGTVQYIVQGAVVAQMTSTGVTFNQTVGGSGFSAGVLAIAQPLDANLTELATPGSIGTLKVSDGANYDDITPGTNGQVLTGVTGGKPVFAAKGRVYSSTLTTTGVSQIDSTGLFSGGNIPATATAMGVTMLSVSTSGAAGAIIQFGDSVGFVTTGYTSGMTEDGGGASGSTDGLLCGIWSVGTDSGYFTFDAKKTPDGYFSTAMGNDFGTDFYFGVGQINLAGLGGKTIDRLRLATTGGTFDSMYAFFWYEV